MSDCCEMCGRLRNLTFHHLIPRTCHKNKWFRKNFSIDEMRSRGVMLCKDCHRFVHATWTEKELGREYNTLRMILLDERTQKFLPYVRKKK